MTWNGGIDYSPDAGAAPSPSTGVTINNSSGELWGAYASAWTAWTPATRTNITVGNGSEYTRYFSIGGRAHIVYKLTLGPTSAIGTDPSLKLTFANNWDIDSLAGVAACWDSSASVWYPAVVTMAATVDTFTTRVTASTPFTWASGDILSVSFSAGKAMPTSTIGE